MSLCVGPPAPNRLVSVTLQFDVIGLASVMAQYRTVPGLSVVHATGKEIAAKVLNCAEGLIAEDIDGQFIIP